MRTLPLLSLLLICAPALASSPHDRVCVGTAKIAGQDPFSFVFQWEIERTYEKGHADEDPHRVTLQARACFDDGMVDSCLVFEEKRILAPKDRSGALSVTLKGKDGKVFFVGSFRFQDAEQLVGKIRRGTGAQGSSEDELVAAPLSLSCVSQPFVALTPWKH